MSELTKRQQSRIRQEERIRQSQQELDNLLTGLELELVIAAVRANKWVTVTDATGFSIPMNPEVQASILRKLEARRS